MLEARNLECTRGDHVLFNNLSFTLSAGELVHLRGSNGSGKTSLLRILCGLFMPTNGEVMWGKENINDLREEYYQEISYFGHLNAIKDELTGIENLKISSKLADIELSEQQALESLEKMGLYGREDLPTKFLSQGQKRRVALARLLFSEAKAWILDEPFTALDVAAVDLLQGLITKHLENGGMVILTTHQDVALTLGNKARQINLDS
ncbi:MAG: cytochrome c biogenesis heme-transporting ATPase CcmA [Gammaproteobacteria bacterium]|nr:cytochrome c biogenesis heme-transporting ATPase CcmA [Gammaproteobacteria bacterium]